MHPAFFLPSPSSLPQSPTSHFLTPERDATTREGRGFRNSSIRANPPPAGAAAAAADPIRQQKSQLAAHPFPTPGGMYYVKGTAVAGLNDDLMVDILSRVPVKDLCRSKCVSKPWRDLIADPLHRKKLPQTLVGFFHGGAQTYGQFTSLSGRGESAPPVDPSFTFLTAKLPGVEHMDLLDSCNGLLLFGCTLEDKFGYIVCNPATEELVTVPASSNSCPPPLFPLGEESYFDVVERKRYAHTYLMFDPGVSSHFHLVQFWENRSEMEVETVHSYSSETRAWSDRSSKWEREGGELGLQGEAAQAIIDFTCGGALVNGLLHFIVYHVKKDNLIVAVDGEGKVCRTIRWHDNHVAAYGAFIGQSQGHLHCISKDSQSQGFILNFTQLSVWVLEDYDTQEWILKHNVSYSQLFGSPSCILCDFDIVAIHPDHNSIIFVHDRNQKLVSYYMDSKELHALHCLTEIYMFITPYVPCFMEVPALATKD